MKRLIALTLAVMMLLSMVACSSSIAPAEAPAATETATAQQTKVEKPAAATDIVEFPDTPITLPEGFSVGYSRRDITPITWPTLFYNGEYATHAHDPLQITCVALSDGENVALIVTVDMRGMNASLIAKTKELLVKDIEGIEIPEENIFINNSHSHSAVDCNQDDPTVLKWKSQVYYKKLANLGEAAVRDLTGAEAYTGTGHTEGITFVRRYFREDGAFTSIHYRETSNAPIVRHESDPDTEMRTLRFEREGKKDVLMVNYQTHYGSAEAMWDNQISADFVHTFREQAEKDLDCHFSYVAGAGGNLVFNSRINGERKYPTFVDGTPHLVDVARQAIASEEKISTGKIQVAHSDYQAANNNTYDPELVRQAKEIQNAGARTAEQQALINKYGFHSRYQANGIVSGMSAEFTTVPFTAITCGDIAFCAFPYEMWDTNGKECREASPCKVTFICSLTNGSFGYIPAAHAFPNGGYEVYSCKFRPGCGEEFVAEMLRLVNECLAKG